MPVRPAGATLLGGSVYERLRQSICPYRFEYGDEEWLGGLAAAITSAAWGRGTGRGACLLTGGSDARTRSRSAPGLAAYPKAAMAGLAARAFTVVAG